MLRAGRKFERGSQFEVSSLARLFFCLSPFVVFFGFFFLLAANSLPTKLLPREQAVCSSFFSFFAQRSAKPRRVSTCSSARRCLFLSFANCCCESSSVLLVLPLPSTWVRFAFLVRVVRVCGPSFFFSVPSQWLLSRGRHNQKRRIADDACLFCISTRNSRPEDYQCCSFCFQSLAICANGIFCLHAHTHT